MIIEDVVGLRNLNYDVLSKEVRQLPAVKSVAVPCLNASECQKLISLVDKLHYRPARPIIRGKSCVPVYQDFSLCYDIPLDDKLWTLAKQLEEPIVCAIREANLKGSDTFHFNDLIVQNYLPGCRGITPHRDHIKYRFIVAILLLSGNGFFYTSTTRDENNGNLIPAIPGDLILMIAPGLMSESLGPIHFVNSITRRRRTIGFRYDSRAKETARSLSKII